MTSAHRHTRTAIVVVSSRSSLDKHYPDNLVKICAWVYAVENPPTLRPKSVAMATVVAGYPQNLISSRSSWGKYFLKLWLNPSMGFGCGIPTNFILVAANAPPDGAETTIKAGVKKRA